MESVGFKEWAMVCAALGRGEQSILLRKGGIAEGRDGFSFRHAEFFLFPTFFHEQLAKTRGPILEMPPPLSGTIEIKYFARVEFSAVVTSWETATALAPFHILQPEVVRERFDYDAAPGIQVALVRVFRLSRGWIFPELPAYVGCRSWVELPPAECTLEPVLRDAEHQSRKEAVQVILNTGR